MMRPGRRLAPASLCLALGAAPCLSAPPQARVEARRPVAQFNLASLDETFKWAWGRAIVLQELSEQATSVPTFPGSAIYPPPKEITRQSIFEESRRARSGSKIATDPAQAEDPRLPNMSRYLRSLDAFRGELLSHRDESVTWKAKVVSIKPDGLRVEARRSGAIPRGGRRQKYLNLEVEFLEPGAEIPEESTKLDTRSGAEIRAQERPREDVIRLDSPASKELARGLKAGAAVTFAGKIRSITLKERRGDWQHQDIVVRVAEARLVAR